MINLLPPKERLNIDLAKRNSILRRYIELAVVAVSLLALLVAGSGYYLQRQEQNTRQTAQLNQAKVESLGSVQDEAQQLAGTIKTISGLLANNRRFSDMLVDIGGLMPSGTALTGLEIAETGPEAPLVISAQVDAEQKAAILRNNLAGSPLFERADIRSIVSLDRQEAGQGAATGPAKDSPYKYLATIDAYFKDGKEKP